MHVCGVLVSAVVPEHVGYMLYIMNYFYYWNRQKISYKIVMLVDILWFSTYINQNQKRLRWIF